MSPSLWLQSEQASEEEAGGDHKDNPTTAEYTRRKGKVSERKQLNNINKSGTQKALNSTFHKPGRKAAPTARIEATGDSGGRVPGWLTLMEGRGVCISLSSSPSLASRESIACYVPATRAGIRAVNTRLQSTQDASQPLHACY